MRASVLDLGSNSFHVLVADLDAGRVTPVHRQREMLHLGAEVARYGVVRGPARDRATETVAHLAGLARRVGAVETHAVATSAIRDAANGPEVIADLSDAAGVAVRVLDGHEEARVGYLGVRASIAVPHEPVLVLDLGGGSLELTVGAAAEVRWSTSLPLGGSRLSALADEDPIPSQVVEELRRRTDAELDPLLREVREHAPAMTVAIGGTVRAMARIVGLDRGVWLPPTLNHLQVTSAELGELRDRLTALDVKDRLAVPGMDERRAGHLHVAAVVLTRVLERLDVADVTVSDWGLREGLLLDAHGLAVAPDPASLRRNEVERLRTTFTPTDPHPTHVAMLAGALFDGLASLHRLDGDDRRLLLAAAEVHSVGESLALRRQHVHGAYLVEHAELRGFDPELSAMLITLVRFHPSRDVHPSFPPFASLDAAAKDRTRRLLALLQLADGLDRARDQAVAGVTSNVTDDVVELELSGGGLHITDHELSRRTALFRTVFGLEVVVHDPARDPEPAS
jgi:exopolyphosphatase / guanosine-5'-triphosphate,3'-diphosphate pyrophosphatase